MNDPDKSSSAFGFNCLERSRLRRILAYPDFMRKWHDGVAVDCSDWRFHVAEREGGRELLSKGSDEENENELKDLRCSSSTIVSDKDEERAKWGKVSIYMMDNVV
jgi:hypothetical protein